MRRDKLTLIILVFVFFANYTYAQPQPPSSVSVRLEESSGNGCGYLSDCENDIACFDIYFMIDEDGWSLQSYNIWLDYGTDNSVLSYREDASCNHLDGGDLNIDQFGKYRVLAGQNSINLQANTEAIIHNVCFDIIDASGLEGLTLRSGGDYYALISSVNLVDQSNSNNTVNPFVPASDLIIGGSNLSCILPAELGDFVWEDLNGNGLQDGGEPGIPGVEVVLHTPDGSIVDQRISDLNGSYFFDDVTAGEYYLEFILPGTDNSFTESKRGFDDQTDSDVTHENGFGTTRLFDLISGEISGGFDAGVYQCALVGEWTWCDYDFNDVFGEEENGVNGLLVNLWRNHHGLWVLWDYMYTIHSPGFPGNDGYWQFCVPPGEYYIEIPTPPYGLVQTLPDIGGDEFRDSDLDDSFGLGTSASFFVVSGQEKLDLAAGFYNMGVIGDKVWLDENFDGQFTPGEPGIEGVIVIAFNDQSIEMGSTTTDAQGNFSIDYLRKDAHYLEFVPPVQYTFTEANVGADESDSDVDASNGNGTTALYNIEPGDNIDMVDAGLILGTLALGLSDFNGVNKSGFNELNWSINNASLFASFKISRRLESELEFKNISGEISKISNKLDYKFNDYDIAVPGKYYYKLSSLNKDGQFNDSKIIVIEVKKGYDDGLSLYPNPSYGPLSIKIPEGINIEKMSVRIFTDLNTKVFESSGGNSVEKGAAMSLSLNELPAGTYLLLLSDGQNDFSQKFIIQK